MESQRFINGEKVLGLVTKSDGLAVVNSLSDVAPELGKWIVEFAYGDVISRKEIDLKSRELSTIAMLGAMGGCEPQLKVHIHGCINVGCTKKEIIEILLQIAVYAGFPRAINAINCAREVFTNELSRT